MNNTKCTYKYLTFFAMLYMTIKLSTILLIYKVITIGPFSATASTLVMPFWFFLGDVIAEVYGYKISRHLIWMAILCQFLFAFICALLIKIDSPPFWMHQAAYDQVLGKLPWIAFASFLAIMSGAFINAYALAKWKILLKGKYFWLRSLGSSAVGELIFTIVAYIMEFFGVVPWQNIIQLMAISFVVKIIFSPILVVPAMLLAKILKRLEGVDIYDYSTNFNPFKLGIDDEDNPSLENLNYRSI